MADDEHDDQKEYRWETGYEKTWEAIQEDDDGLIDGVIADIIQKAKRKRQQEKTKKNRLGMMRHLYIVLDCSESMNVPDLKPTRLLCTLKLLEIFIQEFLDQNPISQLGVIALKAKRAEKISELTGAARVHLKGIQGLAKVPLTSEPSLQNGLDLALKSLKVLPSHASREIVVIMGSLTTCDPVNINDTIDELKKERIRCSVISLSAEIHICSYLTQQTKGTFGAVLDDAHFRDQLLSHVDPPAAAKTQDYSLIRMGFPHHKKEEDGKDAPLSMCMCHIENLDDPSVLSTTGHHCPQCNSKYCELPVECQCCGLTLVSAPHLARSYHHLFPVHNFEEVPLESVPFSSHNSEIRKCYSCCKVLNNTSDKIVFRCGICNNCFCFDCDQFMHETLHLCTGCNTTPKYTGMLQNKQINKPISGGDSQHQHQQMQQGSNYNMLPSTSKQRIQCRS